MLFRSKPMPLIPMMLTLIIVLAACSGNPTSSSSNYNKQPNPQRLIVYVLGFGEQLSQVDTTQNSGYGYANSFYTQNGIQPYLQQTKEFKNAQSLVFSYGGFTSEGKPVPFPCTSTYNNMLKYDESLLNLQITQYLKKHPNTDVYIVSHSLGGVVAFGYLTSVIENTHTTALENGGTLKGLAILDSPLGGVTSDSSYLNTIVAKTLLPGIGCNPQEVNYTTIGGLQTLFNTAVLPTDRGETGSIFSAFIGGKYISNQDIATHAANMGVRILVVGDTNDVLWQPNLCFIGANFLSTEYLNELAKQSNDGALYSRSFASGFRGCRSLVTNRGNHFDVLYQKDVKKAIWETFTNNPVDQLTPIKNMPVVPTPTPGPTLLYSADWSSGLNGWTGSSEWSVANGQLQRTDIASGNPDTILSPFHPPTADYAIEARIQIVSVNDTYGCAVGIRGRASDYEGGYFGGYRSGNGAEIDLIRSVSPNSSFYYLYNQSYTPDLAPHLYRLEFIGNQITLKIDGNLLVQVTDNHSSGPGLVGLAVGGLGQTCPINVSSFQVFTL